jgi:secreted PhoX family phosphatase
MPKDFSTMEDSNRSSNPSIHQISDPARRTVLRGGIGLAAVAIFAPLAGCATAPFAATVPRLGFKGVADSSADTLVVPGGYTATALAPWGEPVGMAGRMPAWAPDASGSAANPCNPSAAYTAHCVRPSSPMISA